MKVGVQQKRLKHVLLGAIFSTVFFCADYSQSAPPYQVINTNDSGAGSLRAAVTQANLDNTGGNLSFNGIAAGSTITLLTPLPLLQVTGGALNIDGSGVQNLIINGTANNVPIFFVYSGTVNISSSSSITLTGQSVGGAGGNAQTPGGGGMGAGGAAFVNTGATLNLTNVIATGSNARGGAGGVSDGGNGLSASGGGMLGGAGIGYYNSAGGGGGGIGPNAVGGIVQYGGGGSQNGNPGGQGLALGAASGGGGGVAGTSIGGLGGLFGGGGGSGAVSVSNGQVNISGGGGGGIGGQIPTNNSTNGGAGGDFGGGGACGVLSNVENGNGGAGGYGSGGGGSYTGPNRAAGTIIDGVLMGGTGSFSGVKGADGGAALGGAYFVRQGGNLSLSSSVNATGASNNTVTGGAAGSVTAAGGAAGDPGKTNANDFYLEAGVNLTFNIPNGVTETIGTLGQSSMSGAGGFTKGNGTGTLVLQGINALAGNQVLTAGVLQGDVQSLSGNITNNATLNFTTTAATGGHFVGTISGNGAVTIQANAGSQVVFSTPQNYTGLTTIAAGSLNLSAANIFLPQNLNDFSLTSATSTFYLAGFPLVMGDLSGIANSTVNLGVNGSLTLGTGNSTTFAGQISGNGSNLIKTGTGTLTLSGNNTYGGTTQINEGSLIVATGGNIGSAQPISIANGMTLQMNGGTLNGNAAITGVANSQLLVTGAFTPGGAITNVPFINVNGGGNLTLGAASIPTGFTAFNVTGGATAAAALTLNANLPIPVNTTMTVSGTAANNGTVNLGTGTIQNSGTLTLETGGVISGAQTIQNNNGATIQYEGGSINSPIQGVGNSSIIVTASSGTGNTITGVRDITVQTGTFTINNSVTNFVDLTIDNGATLALAANLSMNNATLQDNGTLSLGAFTLSGNNASILNINNDFNSTTGNISNVGTINVTNGTYTMNTAPTGFTAFNIVEPGVLTLATNFLLPVNSILAVGGTFNMAGFMLSSTANSATTLNISVPFTTNGSIQDVSQITVQNNGVFTMNTAPTGFSGMTVAVGGTMTLGTGLAIPNNASFTTAGTFNMNGQNLSMGTTSFLNINGPLSTNGSITGDGTYVFAVNGPNGALTINNTVSGYGGLTIAAGGVVNLAANGNLDGTQGNSGIIDNGTLNLNGGVLIAGDIGGNGVVNINDAFTPPGGLAVGTININNGGTLTTVNPIVATTGTTIATGGTLILNQDITGNLTQNGALLNPSGNSQTIFGTYTVANTATRTVQISTSNIDNLVVNGNATINGGTIMVDLPGGGGDIGYQQAFSIVSVNGPGNALTVNQFPTVIVPHSLLVRFDPIQSGQNLQLQAHFIPMVSELNQEDPGLDDMAVVLDSMRGSAAAQSLGNVYGAIDSVETPEELQELLSELAPLGRNMETVAATDAIQNLMSDKILGRMSDSRTAGYSGGDMASNMSSYGPFVFGNGLRQGTRNGVAGYNANTGGFGLLWDAPVMQSSRFGVACAYAASVVRQDDQTRNMVKINNVTGMIYGNTDYGPLFLDGLMSAGLNYYLGKRNVVALGATATSHYQGMQYAAKLRGGFTIPVYTLEISPMATGQYVFMNTGQYTERNAPGVNLTVSDAHFSHFKIGLGARVAEVSQADDFLPEIHALYLYDIKPARLQTSSQFATGGTSFVTTGPLPARAGFNIGGSLTAKAGEDFIFIGGYDFETKKSFVSQSLTLKFRWLF